MRRIIFLDFDGVLNTEYYQGLLQFQGKQWQDQYGAFFDPRAVRQLKRVIDTTGADIVVESSWKYLGLEAMQELWRVRNLPGRVIDIGNDIDVDPRINNLMNDWCQIGTNYSSYLLNCLISHFLQLNFDVQFVLRLLL